jgi:hypothetical protein
MNTSRRFTMIGSFSALKAVSPPYINLGPMSPGMEKRATSASFKLHTGLSLVA